LLGDGELGDCVPSVRRGEFLCAERADFHARNNALAPFLYFLAYVIGVRFLGAQTIHPMLGSYGRLDSLRIIRPIFRLREKYPHREPCQSA